MDKDEAAGTKFDCEPPRGDSPVTWQMMPASAAKLHINAIMLMWMERGREEKAGIGAHSGSIWIIWKRLEIIPTTAKIQAEREREKYVLNLISICHPHANTWTLNLQDTTTAAVILILVSGTQPTSTCYYCITYCLILGTKFHIPIRRMILGIMKILIII